MTKLAIIPCTVLLETLFFSKQFRSIFDLIFHFAPVNIFRMLLLASSYTICLRVLLWLTCFCNNPNNHDPKLSYLNINATWVVWTGSSLVYVCRAVRGFVLGWKRTKNQKFSVRIFKNHLVLVFCFHNGVSLVLVYHLSLKVLGERKNGPK